MPPARFHLETHVVDKTHRTYDTVTFFTKDAPAVLTVMTRKVFCAIPQKSCVEQRLHVAPDEGDQR